MSIHWDKDGLYGSRAQPSVRDAGPLPRPFEWPALGCLIGTIVAALATERAHLHGHDAGVTAGFLLALGVVAFVCTVVSAVRVVQRWYASRREGV